MLFITSSDKINEMFCISGKLPIIRHISLGLNTAFCRLVSLFGRIRSVSVKM